MKVARHTDKDFSARLRELSANASLFDEEIEEGLDLEKISQRCSEQERVSFRAEMSVKTLKKLRMLKKFMDEDAARTYPAYITRIKPFGLGFEVPTLALEGFLHVSELEDDYFQYDQERNMLVGRRSGKTPRRAQEAENSRGILPPTPDRR